MGWTTFAHRGASSRELCIREVASNNEHFTDTVVDSAQVGSTIYMVVLRRPKGEWTPNSIYVNDEDGTVRWLAVFLTSRRKGEFGYKDMEESMGPCAITCPRRLIDTASPLRGTGSYAAEWRAKCAAHRKLTSARKTLVDDTRIKLPEPLDYSGVQVDTFEAATVIRRGRKMQVFRAIPQGFMCRITKLAQREFTILPNATTEAGGSTA